MGRPIIWCTAYPVLTLLSAILALLVYYVVSSSAPCAQLLANTMQTSLAAAPRQAEAPRGASFARQTRRAPPPADDPPPASLVKLVEAYREKFKGPQPTGEDCRKDTNYVYVHWYMATSGTGNRLPSSITGAAIALLTGRRLILPSISKEFFSPTFPVCYHDPGFGGTSASHDVAPIGFPEMGSACACRNTAAPFEWGALLPPPSALLQRSSGIQT